VDSKNVVAHLDNYSGHPTGLLLVQSLRWMR